MFCKECGTENLEQELKCKNCNTYLCESNAPLTGEDRIKIIIFFAFLILPFVWFGLSVIILLIAISSLYIMKKDKSFIAITKAEKYIDIYLSLVAIGFIIFVLLLRLDGGYTFLFLICVILISIIVARIIDFLFFKTLKKHKEWVINNGLFADSKDEKSFFEKATSKFKSIKKEPINIADELLKWAELKEKGSITEEEFQKAKEKILEGKI